MTFVTRNVQLKLIPSISFLSTRVDHQCMTVSRLATSPPPTRGPDILPYSSIPSPPKQLFVDHMPLLSKSFKSMHKLHWELQKEYGDIVKLCIPGSHDTIWCYNPEDAKTIFANDGQFPEKATTEVGEYYRKVIRKDLFPHPGLTSRGKEWQDFRTKVNPILMRKKSIMFYLNDMEIIANELIDVFEREKDEDNRIHIKTPGGFLERWALESVGLIFLGTHLGTLKENVAENSDGLMFIKHVNTYFGEMLKLDLLPPVWKYINVPYYKRFNEAIEGMSKIGINYIDAALNNKSGENIILSKLAEKFDNDRALINVMAIEGLSGATPTTAIAAAFNLYHLASNPDKQEILYQEILATIGPTGSITEPALNKMKYLRCCLQESQRLLPGAIGVTRLAQQDMTLSGYHIPQGSHLVIASQISSRDERFFTKSDAYLPERWSRSGRDESFHPFASIPFSHGPRSCVGKRIAEGELHVLIAKVIQKYRLEYEGGEITQVTGVTHKADRDIVIKLVNRN